MSALLLLAALAFAADPAAPVDALERSLQERRVRIVERLEALRGARSLYEDPRHFSAGAARRRPLVAEVDAELDGFDRDMIVFDEARSDVDIGKGLAALSGVLTGKMQPGQAADAVNTAFGRAKLSADLKGWRAEVRTLRDAETAAFLNAELAAQRRRMKLILGGIALVVAVGMAAALALKPRRRARAAAEGGPETETAALGGRYALERELGRGPSGVVYEAADLSRGDKVAVKILTAGFPDPAAFLQRLRPVQSWAHPGAAALRAAFVSRGRVCLASELATGRSLAEILKETNGPLPLPEIKTVVRDVAVALDDAHLQGLFHGGLKPANVRITAEGKIKVLDFMLAAPQAPYAQEGAPSGKAADLYAMGVLLYEMAVGQLQPGVSPAPMAPALDAVVRKALSPDQGQRYRSASELARALDAV